MEKKHMVPERGKEEMEGALRTTGISSNIVSLRVERMGARVLARSILRVPKEANGSV